MAGKVSSDPNVFLLPDIGEGLQEAEVIKWLVSEGDEVEENQALAEVQTDKALTEIPSPRAGKIAKLHGADGEVMKVGEPFVSYVGGGSSATPKAPPAKAPMRESEPQEEREDAGTVVGQMSGELAGVSRAGGKALATPAVRRLARDLGIDIDSVKGTGIGGRVTKRDVEAAKAGGGASKPASAPAAQSPAQSPAQPTERGTTRRPMPQQPARPQAQAYPQQPQPYPQQQYPQQAYPQGYPQQYPQPPMMPGYAPYPMPYMMPMPWGYMPPMTMPHMPPMPGHPGMQGAGIPAAPGFTPFQSGRPVPPPAQVSSVEPGSGTASVPFKGVRRVIAGKLRQSVDTAVHFTVMDEADVTALDDLRRRLTAETGQKLSFLPFIASAVCRALAGPFGALNARVDDERDEIVQHEAVHLGIATDTDSGLMVPVLRDADRADVFSLSDRIASLAASARDRSIPREELTGSTFTISNVGSHAGRFATPVINYPEVGIIAVGKAYDGVVVRDGQPMVAKLMPLSLACDHRVVDGATAALCLAEIVRLLQEPEQLV